MKNGTVIAVAVALLAVGLFIFIPWSSIGDDPEPVSPPVEFAESEPLPEIDPAVLEEGFVRIVRDNYPVEYQNESDGDIVMLGYTVCDAMDAGVSFVEVVQASYGTGIPAYAAAFTAGAAVGTFCPEHSDKITE